MSLGSCGVVGLLGAGVRDWCFGGYRSDMLTGGIMAKCVLILSNSLLRRDHPFVWVRISLVV